MRTVAIPIRQPGLPDDTGGGPFDLAVGGNPLGELLRPDRPASVAELSVEVFANSLG
jgi:hypothetical protein